MVDSKGTAKKLSLGEAEHIFEDLRALPGFAETGESLRLAYREELVQALQGTRADFDVFWERWRPLATVALVYFIYIYNATPSWRRFVMQQFDAILPTFSGGVCDAGYVEVRKLFGRGVRSLIGIDTELCTSVLLVPPAFGLANERAMVAGIGTNEAVIEMAKDAVAFLRSMRPEDLISVNNEFFADLRQEAQEEDDVPDSGKPPGLLC